MVTKRENQVKKGFYFIKMECIIPHWKADGNDPAEKEKMMKQTRDGIMQWQNMPENKGEGGSSAHVKELAAEGSRDSLSMETRRKAERRCRQIWWWEVEADLIWALPSPAENKDEIRSIRSLKRQCKIITSERRKMNSWRNIVELPFRTKGSLEICGHKSKETSKHIWVFPSARFC